MRVVSAIISAMNHDRQVSCLRDLVDVHKPGVVHVDMLGVGMKLDSLEPH